jgi:hypothetical protein
MYKKFGIVLSPKNNIFAFLYDIKIFKYILLLNILLKYKNIFKSIISKNLKIKHNIH